MALRRSTRFLSFDSFVMIAQGFGSWRAGMEVGWATRCSSNHIPGMIRLQSRGSEKNLQDRINNSCDSLVATSSEAPNDNQAIDRYSGDDSRYLCKHQIGENVSRKDKTKFLVNTLFDLRESKEVVYGALDSWVAWEQNFPLASLRRALITLEKEQQWHKVVQVIKWMLSKGQGKTMGTYGQLIRALEKDNRAEEAHKFWEKKIGYDLHSVPWQLCNLMIGIYYRNNMLERLVKLFKGLEAFDRKPPGKSVVQKVADAYEVLGLLEEQKRVLEKYNYLFTESSKGYSKRTRKGSRKKDKEKTGERKEQNSDKVSSGSSPTFAGAEAGDTTCPNNIERGEHR